MFKSTKRPILIPQSEHLKLVGALAWHWGNERFEFPPLPRLSVVTGIGLHDRGYGYLDNHAVGEVDDDTWLGITRRGFYMPCSDPAADLITRHHLLRLVNGRSTSGRQALAEEMQAEIQAQIFQHSFSLDLFRQIDTLTRLCDNVSFDFCRESDAQGAVVVYSGFSGGEQTAVRYRISGSRIVLNPWPLQVERLSGYLVGYRLDGYPDTPEALLVPYEVARME